MIYHGLEAFQIMYAQPIKVNECNYRKLIADALKDLDANTFTYVFKREQVEEIKHHRNDITVTELDGCYLIRRK